MYGRPNASPQAIFEKSFFKIQPTADVLNVLDDGDRQGGG